MLWWHSNIDTQIWRVFKTDFHECFCETFGVSPNVGYLSPCNFFGEAECVSFSVDHVLLPQLLSIRWNSSFLLQESVCFSMWSCWKSLKTSPFLHVAHVLSVENIYALAQQELGVLDVHCNNNYCILTLKWLTTLLDFPHKLEWVLPPRYP